MFLKSLFLPLLTIHLVRAHFSSGGGGGGGYGIEASGGYGQDAPRQVKLNLGLHVPPIILKMPRMSFPQMTIKANFIRQPYAKPLEINMPPPPQIQFGDDSGYGSGGYGGGGGGGGGGGASNAGGYGGAAPAPMSPPSPPAEYGGNAPMGPNGYAGGGNMPSPSAEYGGGGGGAGAPGGYGAMPPSSGEYGASPSPYGMMTNVEMNKIITLNTDPNLANQHGQYGGNNQGYYYPQATQISSIPVLEAKSSSNGPQQTQIMVAPSSTHAMTPMPIPVPYIQAQVPPPPTAMVISPYQPNFARQDKSNHGPPQDATPIPNGPGFVYPYPAQQVPSSQTAPMPMVPPFMPPQMPWNGPPGHMNFEHVMPPMNHQQRSSHK